MTRKRCKSCDYYQTEYVLWIHSEAIDQWRTSYVRSALLLRAVRLAKPMVNNLLWHSLSASLSFDSIRFDYNGILFIISAEFKLIAIISEK